MKLGFLEHLLFFNVDIKSFIDLIVWSHLFKRCFQIFTSRRSLIFVGEAIKVLLAVFSCPLLEAKEQGMSKMGGVDGLSTLFCPSRLLEDDSASFSISCLTMILLFFGGELDKCARKSNKVGTALSLSSG